MSVIVWFVVEFMCLLLDWFVCVGLVILIIELGMMMVVFSLILNEMVLVFRWFVRRIYWLICCVCDCEVYLKVVIFVC